MLKRLNIGPRLVLSFAVVAVCMFAGSTVAFWQMQVVRREAERMERVDQSVVSILRVHNDVLAFRNTLKIWIDARDARLLAEGVGPLREHLIADVDAAHAVLESSAVEAQRQGLTLSALETIGASLPAQLDVMIEMARAGDWDAVELRFNSQVQTLSEDTRVLAEQVDAAVTAERQQILAGIRSVQRRAMATLLLAGALTLLVAVTLGFSVTRSIAHPLARLTQGAEALASGNFTHEVEVSGRDDLARLGRVFNDTSAKLRELYQALELTKDAAVAKATVLSGLLPICAWCKKIRDDQGYWNQIETYVSERSEVDFSHGICPECVKKNYPEVGAKRKSTGTG